MQCRPDGEGPEGPESRGRARYMGCHCWPGLFLGVISLGVLTPSSPSLSLWPSFQRRDPRRPGPVILCGLPNLPTSLVGIETSLYRPAGPLSPSSSPRRADTRKTPRAGA